MAISQSQKVDFLYKKLGFTKTKTGLSVDGALSGTKKAGFGEVFASPLVIADSSVWNQSELIPTTPPGSDTSIVKGYRVASALRMTVDATTAGRRSYIAYTTFNDTSSARLTNWIDTQFGNDYVVKVYAGDPNSGGTLLPAGGTTGNDSWFFDYSAGILQFHDTTIHSNIDANGSNIYIVGYRYIGQTGVISIGDDTNFGDLTVNNNFRVAGLSTFVGAVNLNDNLSVAGITTLAGLSTVTGHTLFTKQLGVSGISTFGGDVNVNTNTKIKVGTGLTAFFDGTSAQYHNNSNVFHILQNSGQREGWSSKLMVGVTTVFVPQFRIHHNSAVELYYANGFKRLSTSGIGATIYGQLDTTQLIVSGVSTFTSNIIANSNIDLAGDIDVDGHTELDNLNVSGVSTFVGNAQFDGNVSIGGTLTYEDVTNVDSIGIITARDGIDCNSDLDVDGNLSVSGISTFTGAIDANGNLDVDGIANLDDVDIDGNLDVAGISTFQGLIDANGKIVGAATSNVIPFLHSNFSDLPAAGTYHGAFAHVHATEKGYFAHGGAWYELVNRKLDGTVGTGTDSYNVGIITATQADIGDGGLDVDGHTELDNLGVSGVSTFSNTVKIGTGVTALTDGNVSIGGTIEIFETSGVTNQNYSQFKLSTFSIGQHNNVGTMKIMNNNATGSLIIGAGGGGGYGGISLFNKDLNARYLQAHNEGSVDLYYDGDLFFATTGVGATIFGNTETQTLNVTGVSTFAGAIDANGNLDVDGYTELDDLNVSGVSTFAGAIDANSDLDVDGQTNLDDVSIAGVTTTTENINIDADNKKLQIGDGQDIKLYHNTGNSFIENSTGYLLVNSSGGDTVIRSNNDVYLQPASGENAVKATANGSVDLYYDSSTYSTPKFTTTGYGATVFGTTETQKLNVTGISTVVGVGTFKDDVYIDKKLYVAGIEIGGPGGPGIGTDITTRNLNVTGIATVTGNTDLNGDLDVDGLTNLDNTIVAGVSTFQDNVTINKDKKLTFDRFGTEKTVIRYNDTITATQIRNSSDNLEIGYRPVHLMWLTNSVLNTKLGGVHVNGNVESDTLTVGINTTATNPRVTVGGNSQFNGNVSVGAGGTVFTAIVGAAASVGIGDASPSYMLDVAGAINSQTDVKINGVSVTEQALNDAVAMAIALG